MSQLNEIPPQPLHFYLTASYPCSYLPGLQARSQVAAPSHLVTPSVYSELVLHGFRRSGTYTYRPRCDGCQACVPLRVLAREFAMTRAQRRNWARNADIAASLHELRDKPEYFALYQRYQQARHKGGGMDNDDRDSYQSFLLQSQVGTVLVEFRAGEKLLMVSVIDLLPDGLSAVYTFFDPDLPRLGLGVYNILWQIDLCRELELDYVYLGYWIRASRKMSYKTQYQPAQGLMNSTWQPIDKEAQ